LTRKKPLPEMARWVLVVEACNSPCTSMLPSAREPTPPAAYSVPADCLVTSD
jgi:hypothetical protein